MNEERSAMDSRLLAMARKSPQEIAEATGMSPEYVAERISQLLEQRDWLTERQEERLILMEAADLKDKAMSMMQDTNAENFAGVANVALRTLKLVSERLDARRKLIDSDIQKITRAQAEMFGNAFEIALLETVRQITALGEVPDEQTAYTIAQDALKKAGKQLAKVTDLG